MNVVSYIDGHQYFATVISNEEMSMSLIFLQDIEAISLSQTKHIPFIIRSKPFAFSLDVSE